MPQFVSLFDKPLKLVLPDNSEITFPAHEAPVFLSYTESNQTLNGVPLKVRTLNVPPILNLPSPIEGTVFLVPSGVAFMANRQDFVVAFGQPMPDGTLTAKGLFKQE